jgi:hypothetical protein
MLLNMEQLPYFNKTTLGQILEKNGENLNYWIKKLLKNGEIIALKKGLYISRIYLLSLSKNPDISEKYMEYLANIVRYPSYISLEYALSKYGVIPEGIYSITSVTTKSSRVYQNMVGNFVYKSIKTDLFGEFDYLDFEEKRIKFASKVKALFDFLYFKREPELRAGINGGFRINWDVFTQGDKEKFNDIVAKSKSFKIQKVVKILPW